MLRTWALALAELPLSFDPTWTHTDTQSLGPTSSHTRIYILTHHGVTPRPQSWEQATCSQPGGLTRGPLCRRWALGEAGPQVSGRPHQHDQHPALHGSHTPPVGAAAGSVGAGELMHTHVHTHTHIYITHNTCVCLSRVHAHTRAHAFTQMCTYTCLGICVRDTGMRTHVNTHIDMHTHTNNTFRHADINTHPATLSASRHLGWNLGAGAQHVLQRDPAHARPSGCGQPAAPQGIFSLWGLLEKKEARTTGSPDVFTRSLLEGDPRSEKPSDCQVGGDWLQQEPTAFILPPLESFRTKANFPALGTH